MRRDEVTVCTPAGDVGFGFDEGAVATCVAAGVDAIAAQGTSTDPGPFYLGTGTSYIPRSGVVSDVKQLIRIGLKSSIPLLLSVGGAGTDSELDAIVSEIRQWAESEGLQFRLATLRTSVPSGDLIELIRDGLPVVPLPGADQHFGPTLSDDEVRASTNIVVQIGPEPFIDALEKGADVVIAGRALDVAMYAAVPLMRGIPPATAFLMAKTLECGGLVCDPSSLITGAVAHARGDSFTIHPTDANSQCTPRSVMAHILYEEADGRNLTFPGISVDLSAVAVSPIGTGGVVVTGAQAVKTRRSVKIEGARRIGFRSVCMAGVRDDRFLDAIPEALAKLKPLVTRRFGKTTRVDAQIFGGLVDGRADACLVLDVIGPTLKEATEAADFTKGFLMHFGFPGRKTTSGNLAMFFSPNVIRVGPVFEFSIYHLVPTDDPWLFCRPQLESFSSTASPKQLA